MPGVYNGSCRQQRAQFLVASLGRRRAEKQFEGERGLADQHVEPVDGVESARLGGGEQPGTQRRIDEEIPH